MNQKFLGVCSKYNIVDLQDNISLLLNLGVLIELKDNDIEEPLIRWSMVSPNYILIWKLLLEDKDLILQI